MVHIFRVHRCVLDNSLTGNFLRHYCEINYVEGSHVPVLERWEKGWKPEAVQLTSCEYLTCKSHFHCVLIDPGREGGVEDSKGERIRSGDCESQLCARTSTLPLQRWHQHHTPQGIMQLLDSPLYPPVSNHARCQILEFRIPASSSASFLPSRLTLGD